MNNAIIGFFVGAISAFWVYSTAKRIGLSLGPTTEALPVFGILLCFFMMYIGSIIVWIIVWIIAYSILHSIDEKRIKNIRISENIYDENLRTLKNVIKHQEELCKQLEKLCRRLFKTGFLACSKPDSPLEAKSP